MVFDELDESILERAAYQPGLVHRDAETDERGDNPRQLLPGSDGDDKLTAGVGRRGRSRRPESRSRPPTVSADSSPTSTLATGPWRSSSIDPWATIDPRSITATWSQIFSTSVRRWLFRNTVAPRSFKCKRTSRTSILPSGSSALVGSSRNTSWGRPTNACASPSRCCMPLDSSDTLRSPESARPTSVRRSVGVDRDPHQPAVEAQKLSARQPSGEAEVLG